MNLSLQRKASRLVCLMGPLLSVHPLLAESVTVNVAPDPKACTIVHLPSWKKPVMPSWTHSDWLGGMRCDLDFRSFDGGVLVGASCRPEPKLEQVYSPSKYAVYFGTGRVRKATEDEWNHADPYLNFRVTANRLGYNFKPDQKLIYQGKEFAKTGAKWPFAFGISHVSQDGSFLAVNSWDGIQASNGDDSPILGREYLDGQYFVDVYNVASGRRILAIDGHFHGVGPDEMFRNSAWISKRYFVLPLDWTNKLRNFVICDVERASRSAGNLVDSPAEGVNGDVR